MSPQVSRPRRRLPTGMNSAAGSAGAEMPEQLVAHGGRVGEQVPALVALPVLDRLQDLGLLLRAHPRHGADAAGPRRGGQVVEAGDAEGRVEPRHGLRPHALQPQQVEHRGRELFEQGPVVGGGARVGELANPGGQVLADAGDRAQLGVGHPCDRVAGRRHGVGGGAVGADLERVLALDLEQIGDLAEHLRDRAVIHASARGART